jgi:hypothetical protein
MRLGRRVVFFVRRLLPCTILHAQENECRVMWLQQICGTCLVNREIMMTAKAQVATAKETRNVR